MTDNGGVVPYRFAEDAPSMKACPSCGWSSSSPDSPATTEVRSYDLARLDSVAEAGYLVSLLEEAGVPAVARPLEAFDAARGAWSSTYTVSIAADDRQAAARVLEAESHHDFVRLAEQVFDSPAGAGETPSVNPWGMLAVLAVVAVTGLLAFGTLGDPHRRNRRAQPPRPEADRPEPLEALVAALGAEAAPLRSEAGVGPRRRLHYAPSSETLILSTDADGDGQYESRRRFAARPIDPTLNDR